MTKRALISVSDKTGIIDFAKALRQADFEIISTGGTRAVLQQAGVETIEIDAVTGFKEMLDGRVKTLHPMIHAGLLADLSKASHVEALAENEITPIDLVVVNLYPFAKTIANPDVIEAQAIEQIDIGGPSMLRSAAKNFAHVTVVVDQKDYAHVLSEINEIGKPSYQTRRNLAMKVFQHTASYDAMIANYFIAQEAHLPEKLVLSYTQKQPLRYGENPHQEAAFYVQEQATKDTIAGATQLHGKALSYNNIKDADAALEIAKEFQKPTVVAVKHMNPCGVGSADTLAGAFEKAYAADPVSIFGGIIACNREVDVQVAQQMSQLFLEVILAPSYTPEAQALLEKKKNLRLLQIELKTKKTEAWEYTSVSGGMLVQAVDAQKTEVSDWEVVTKRNPSEAEIEALLFAWRTVKHVKSNAIVLADHTQTVGIGAGQMNRVGSVEIALNQAKDKMDQTTIALASDAFFPMSDSVEVAATNGIKAIIQPGGSIKDQESIDMANKYGVTMIFTHSRHFRH
ncbi:bifunctional phosphoribosylaminoimidazolecarboxamide formyltransferase/IMP cyclohydrolase [Enterococcus bulliens]